MSGYTSAIGDPPAKTCAGARHQPLGLQQEIAARMPDRGTVLPTGIDVGSATDVGRVREANEDSMLALAAGDGQLLVAVADGMGGHKAGEVASELAVTSLRSSIEQAGRDADPERVLIDAVEMANIAIWDAAAEDIEKEGMGTTLVAALITSSGRIAIANVGDSRAYAVIRGKATLVTTDHTWVNQQVLAKQMSEREARTSPYRNLLTRALGSTPRVQVDIIDDVQIGPGDALVLVSDGVTAYLEERDVAGILRASATAQEAAEQLVSEAVDRGGADNATAVVVRRV